MIFIIFVRRIIGKWIIKQLDKIFVSEIRTKVKGQEPRLIKINTMKKLDASSTQVKYQEQHF